MSESGPARPRQRFSGSQDQACRRQSRAFSCPRRLTSPVRQNAAEDAHWRSTTGLPTGKSSVRGLHEVAAPGARGVVCGLLCLAVPAAVGSSRAARVADRHDPRGPRRVIRDVWRQARATELVLGRAIRVGHNAVAMLMRRAGIQGRTRSPKRHGVSGGPTADDLVDRIFVREGPNQLWVTDITEHPTREGKLTPTTQHSYADESIGYLAVPRQILRSAGAYDWN